MSLLLLFETTHHAMWAEEIARAEGIAAEVVPAPEHVDAKCGLALEFLEGDRPQLTAALEREGVPFKLNE